MSISAAFAVAVPANKSLFRITSSAFLTPNPLLHPRVVDGNGAVKSRHGARYNHPGARAVYLAEDVPLPPDLSPYSGWTRVDFNY